MCSSDLASDERYRSLLAELDAVVTVVAADGRDVFVAGQTEEIFGAAPAALATPDLWRDAILPEDRRRVAAARAAAQGSPRYELDYRIRRPDGEIAWLNERMRAALGPDGGPARWYGVVTDITASRRSELEAAASRAAFEAVFENSPLYSVIVRLVRDEAGEIDDWEFQAVNEAAVGLLELPADEVLGRRARELFGEAAVAPIEHTRSVVAGGRAQTSELVLPANGRTYQVTSFAFGADQYGLLAQIGRAHV